MSFNFSMRKFVAIAAVDWNSRDDQKGSMGALLVSGILTDAGTAMNRSEDIHRSVDVGGVGLV